ncbi:tRNA (guanosine(46)-N7)-methyltransferase TrmB [Luteolibacter sp. LG18]|uniref:tRNA (guanosine(46)-N7)-methyltransferase TrmB n=1 Tax=Luteolibacter sp. LG18 TaxID=2819286 RepID=UPI002B2AC53B|nr:tRNA (guanine-N(7)-)-methyltransferase [Luteolibacter sp. LG18]
MTATEPARTRTAFPAEFMPADYFKRWEPVAVFGDAKPLEIDLGCGDGSFLLGMAEQYPERNFLGVERLLGRVRKVSKRITKAGLPNAKVLRLESRYTVEWLLPPASASRMHLLCPDPWPKAKHHRRRLIQQPFLEAVWNALQPGGEFLFMTDHPEYYEWGVEEIAKFARFERLEWEEDTFFYPKTDFQIQWEAEGKRMWRLRVRKPAGA